MSVERTYGRLTVTVDHGDGRVRVFAIGEVDMATADVLAGSLDRALEGGLPVVVDLSGVTFLDCAGIRTLIQGGTRALGNGQALTVANASPIVRRVLEICGVWAWLAGQLTDRPVQERLTP